VVLVVYNFDVYYYYYYYYYRAFPVASQPKLFSYRTCLFRLAVNYFIRTCYVQHFVIYATIMRISNGRVHHALYFVRPSVRYIMCS